MSDHPASTVYNRRQSRAIPDWISLFTGVGMMAMLGLVVDPGNEVIEPQTLGVVAGLGYLLGFLLAGLRLNDMLAHVMAAVLGIGVAGVAIEPNVAWSLVRAGSVAELARRNWDRTESIATAVRAGDRLPDDAANLGIVLTLWLVGYISAWMMFRRGWFVWSIALPATILLVSLALERDQPAWPAFGFTGLAIAQGVNATARARTGRWTRSGMRTPRNVSRWSATGGAVLAAIVIVAASSAALTVPDNTQNWITGKAQSFADQVTEQLDRLPTQNGNNPAQSNYGEFADTFTVGEGVASGDTPVALLQAVDRHYLAARRFDTYDGTGWSATLGELPNLEGIQPFAEAPRIAFSAGQAMNLPQTVLESRSRVEGTITLYQPTGGLLMTLESHLSSSIPSSIRVGWELVDAEIDVDAAEVDQVPLDLRTLVGLLRLATYDETDLANGIVTITDPTLRGAIDDERENLRQHYPVITTLFVDPEFGVSVTAKGRLPIYTDIEAVFYSGGETRPDTYEVLGLAPNVTEADLAAASTEYPDYIVDRYLQLPDTVTPRTGALARQVIQAESASDPYSMARAIENHLRTSYSYLLEAGLGPEGTDIVDHFLFEQQVGRCDHFASAMVVMLRSLGVPARIVTGLAPVEHDPAAGGFLYRGRDAHAWVEVYFSGYGWIPFEPTPSEDPLEIDRGTNAQQGPVRPTPQAPEPSPEANQAEQPEPEASPVPTVFEQPPASGDGGSGLTSFPGILAPIAAAASLLAGVLFIMWRWPLRQLQPGASYFFRLQRLGSFLGIKSEHSMTPGEYARRYGTAHPRYSGAALTIADAFTDERYGPPETANSAAERGFAGWRQLRSSILGWRPWRRKGWR